jgi:DNA-binding response OmpR family regulator
VIVLDIMLPGMNGYRVCSTLRETDDWTPILMLTAKDGEHDEAEALDTGADDFLSKPFSFVVLTARLRALIRRGKLDRPTLLTAGDLTIDPVEHSCRRGDDKIALTPREFSILEYLMRRVGAVVPKSDILGQVWDFAFTGDPNIVEVNIANLRKKVDTPFDRHAIETVRGVGYRLAADGG